MSSGLPEKFIRDDPLYYKDFVQKFVRIKTLNHKIFQGTLFTVDPNSDNIILVSYMDGKPCIDVIMGSMVHSIQLCGQPTDFYSDSNIGDKIFENKQHLKEKLLTGDEIKLRKQELKDWLSKNLVNVTEEGDLLKLDDILVIHPPYGVQQCSSSNQIVLGKVQSLIKRMSVKS